MRWRRAPRRVRGLGRAAARLARLGSAGLLAIVAGGCFPAAATAEGRDIGTLYGGFMAVAAVVSLVVLVPATLAILRFRRRGGGGLPTQNRGHVGLELTWTALPAITVVGLFIATLLVLLRVDATSAPQTTEISVTAFRWGWRFDYPQEGVTVEGLGEPGPEIAVPVGEPITLHMASSDVIHSFYVPLFLFKRDVNPDRPTTFQFTVEEPGTYRGQCAEFCGIYHARMPFSVLALARPEYDAWLTTARAAADPAPSGSPSVAPSPASPSPPAASP